MKQMIVKIDSDASFDLLPDETQLAIQAAGVQYPEGMMIGTKSYYGKRLILIITPLPKADIESLITEHDLTWSVVACEGELITQLDLLKYFEDVNIYDADGNVTGTTPITNLNGIMQTYSGHTWIYN